MAPRGGFLEENGAGLAKSLRETGPGLARQRGRAADKPVADHGSQWNLRLWDRRGRARLWRHGAGVVCAVACLLLLGSTAFSQGATAPADAAAPSAATTPPDSVATPDATAPPEAIAVPAPASSTSLNAWGGLFIRYLILSIICGGAFTLIFLKCWRDASAAANQKAELPSQTEDPPAEVEKSRRKANA
jgi:hypothetical protein